MLRTESPMNQILYQSQNVFRFCDYAAQGLRLTNRERELFDIMGGTVEKTTQDGVTEYTVSMSHAKTDAFGMLYFFRDQDMIGSHALPNSGMKQFIRDELLVSQFWCPIKEIPELRTATPTQSFFRTFLPYLRHAQFDGRICLTISTENPQLLTLENIPGNSFVLSQINVEEAETLAQADLLTWRDSLERLGAKTKKILSRVKTLSPAVPNSIVISPLGHLSALRWGLKLHPANFCGYSTPATLDSASVFLWSTGQLQVLSIVCDPKHFLTAYIRKIASQWMHHDFIQ